MYHYRVRYSSERRGQEFSDTIVISSPYSLNESYADATFVLHQIRFELQGRSKKRFKIHMIEVTEPPVAEEKIPQANSGEISS